MNKIEIFGDSVMGGVICDSNWRLKFRNDSKYSYLRELGYDIRNNAKIGATIKKGLQIIAKRINELNTSTTAILEFGGNDCSYNWKDMFNSADTLKEPYVPISEYSTLISDAIDSIQATGASVAVCNLVPIDSERYFDWICTQGPRDTILEWLGDKQMIYHWHEIYNHELERIASEKGCDLINIRRNFLLRHDYKQLMSQDGIHPTEEGYKIIDQAFSEYFHSKQSKSVFKKPIILHYGQA